MAPSTRVYVLVEEQFGCHDFGWEIDEIHYVDLGWEIAVLVRYWLENRGTLDQLWLGIWCNLFVSGSCWGNWWLEPTNTCVYS